MPKPRNSECTVEIVDVTADGITFKILDDELWSDIKNGKVAFFEIEGVPKYAEAA